MTENIERDQMYEFAKRFVINHRRSNISAIQRHLGIGYNRAAIYIEEMEKDGILGPLQTDGTREILVAAPEQEHFVGDHPTGV